MKYCLKNFDNYFYLIKVFFMPFLILKGYSILISGLFHFDLKGYSILMSKGSLVFYLQFHD